MTISERSDQPQVCIDEVCIDAERWPDVVAAPRGKVRGFGAKQVFSLATANLPIDVEYPDGRKRDRRHGGVLPRMIIRDEKAMYRRIGADGLIGFGESFMAGEWTTDDLVGLLIPFAERAGELVPAPLQRLRRLLLPSHPADERNSVGNTRSNISRHYDLSNDLFAAFLDPTLSYSSAYFGSDAAAQTATHDDLAAAQRVKIDRLLDAAQVGPGSRVLEIGTGWGELCIRAAARGAQVRSLTLSSEQRELALTRIAEAGFSDRVDVDLLDYRQADGEYDAVVSVEMLEAVGREFWPEYFRTVERLLVPGGKAAIQVITMPHDRMLASTGTYTWVHKYIFPGGQLPSIEALRDVTQQCGVPIVDELAMGQHYARTLQLWRESFAMASGRIAELGFDEIFTRMWNFYLAYSEAGFRAGYLDVYQLQLAKPRNAREVRVS